MLRFAALIVALNPARQLLRRVLASPTIFAFSMILRLKVRAIQAMSENSVETGLMR